MYSSYAIYTQAKLTVTSTIISISQVGRSYSSRLLPLQENITQIQCHIKPILTQKHYWFFFKPQDNVHGINSHRTVILQGPETSTVSISVTISC